MNKTIGILTVLLFFVSSSVYADTGWYIKTSLGKSSADFDLDVDLDDFGYTSISGDDSSFGIGVGYWLNDSFSIELSQTNYGESKESYSNVDSFGDTLSGTASGDIDALSVSIVGSFPVSESLSLFGKIGYADWNVDFQDNYSIAFLGGGGFTDSISADDSGNDILFGFGAVYSVSERLGLTLEYEQLPMSTEPGGIDIDIDVNTFALGLSFSL